MAANTPDDVENDEPLGRDPHARLLRSSSEKPPEKPIEKPPENLPEEEPPFPDAKEKWRRFSGVWILPIIAALIAGYLAIRSYTEHGPGITISFKSAEGLSVGQTQIKYKAVTLGTVDSISLKPDNSGIIVHAATTASARNFLTDHTLFWIVRPQLNATNLTDLQLLVSGTYIQLEPGTPGGHSETSFTGLERPPDIRSDQVGRVFVLKTSKLGALNTGSPVYYRDINVGQVLNYDLGNGFGPITMNIFVRDPYAKYVRDDSRFWNASGLNITLSGGLHLEFQSIQSVLTGGIAFYTPESAIDHPEAEAKSIFTLFESRPSAEMADGKRFQCISYFQAPVKDLAPGSPVQIYGMHVGEVTDVKLIFNPQKDQPHVRVSFEIKPDLAFGPAAKSDEDTAKIMHALTQKGMRAVLETNELVAGRQVISLEFSPRSQPVSESMEGSALVVPGAAGGIGNVADAISDVAGKLNQIPFAEIGEHLNHLLASADQTFGGQEMKKAMHDLADTLANADKVSKSASDNLTPALQRLPDISNQLQGAIAHANEFMNSVNAGYGDDSDFHRGVKRVMDEVNDAARSIRLLADFLDRHPEALLSGKSGDTEMLDKSKP